MPLGAGDSRLFFGKGLAPPGAIAVEPRQPPRLARDADGRRAKGMRRGVVPRGLQLRDDPIAIRLERVDAQHDGTGHRTLALSVKHVNLLLEEAITAKIGVGEEEL